jgi:hypothetical protein
MDIQRQKKSKITAALLTLIRSVWGGFFYSGKYLNNIMMHIIYSMEIEKNYLPAML